MLGPLLRRRGAVCVLILCTFPALRGPATASPPEPDDAAAPATAAGAPAPVEPAAVEPAPSESLALGRPNGVLSARPAPEKGAGVLAALDPRRSDLARTAGALAVVIGLLAVLRVVLRRASGVLPGGRRPSGVMEILARYPVGRGQTLLLIKMGRRLLLVHQAPAAMTTLSEVTDPEEVAALLARCEAGARVDDAARFRSALRAFDREHDRLAGAPAERGEVEVIDLTRRRGRGAAARLGRRRVSA